MQKLINAAHILSILFCSCLVLLLLRNRLNNTIYADRLSIRDIVWFIFSLGSMRIKLSFVWVWLYLIKSAKQRQLKKSKTRMELNHNNNLLPM